MVDQISEGQIEWEKLDDEFDVVSIDYGEKNRRYELCEGIEQWRKKLKKQFPDEEEGIDKFIELIKLGYGTVKFRILLKIMPLWLSLFLIKTGLLQFITKLWPNSITRTAKA